MSRRSDQRYLVDVAYVDDAGFNARLSLYKHQEPRIDLVGEVIASLGELDGRRVVDVGCGNGQYLGSLCGGGATVIGVDLSPGMLAAARDSGVSLAAGDASALPIGSGLIDIVLLLHMLYHLPEPAAGIDEAARIASERGCVVVATNGADHLAELNRLWLPLLERAGIITDVEDAGLVNPRLNGDAAGALLRGRFIDVTERRLRSTVILTDPGPALAHAASTTAGRLAPPEFLDRLRADIEAIIARHGAFRITTDVALFHARQQR